MKKMSPQIPFFAILLALASCSTNDSDVNVEKEDAIEAVVIEEQQSEETQGDVRKGGPFFNANQNPLPNGKKWVKVEAMSDEFNDSSFNVNKWKNTDPNRWIGRPPGLFTESTVSEKNGNLRLTCKKLPSPRVVNGKTFTHEGSNITSHTAGQVGYYFEARMKANKTFMSSTFWLINNANDTNGCDKRTIELDIQECVGQIVGTANFAQNFNRTIHSNTHSRNTTCATTPTGSVGGNKELYNKVYESYHVYAAWWKSKTEIVFYLDGNKVYSITPKADFDLPLYLKLVTETYDWNPVPSDGGMKGTWGERTTFYDWVRTYKLENL